MAFKARPPTAVQPSVQQRRLKSLTEVDPLPNEAFDGEFERTKTSYQLMSHKHCLVQEQTPPDSDEETRSNSKAI